MCASKVYFNRCCGLDKTDVCICASIYKPLENSLLDLVPIGIIPSFGKSGWFIRINNTQIHFICIVIGV